MKITTFDPMIITKKREEVVKFIEELGFVTTHAPVTTVELGDAQTDRMKNRPVR